MRTCTWSSPWDHRRRDATTRRFFDRPPRVPFVATGLAEPLPIVATVTSKTDRAARSFSSEVLTARARAALIARLAAVLPKSSL